MSNSRVCRCVWVAFAFVARCQGRECELPECDKVLHRSAIKNARTHQAQQSQQSSIASLPIVCRSPRLVTPPNTARRRACNSSNAQTTTSQGPQAHAAATARCRSHGERARRPQEVRAARRSCGGLGGVRFAAAAACSCGANAAAPTARRTPHTTKTGTASRTWTARSCRSRRSARSWRTSRGS